ncbi:hypothetical protein B4U79_16779, partial [Dinothrombium tinctorium]
MAKSEHNFTTDDLRQLVSEAVSNSSFNAPRKIEPFSGAPHKDVIKWLDEFEYYATAVNWTDDVKKLKLPFFLSDLARDWYTVFVAPNPALTGGTWANLKAALKEYFLPSSYDSFLREEIVRRVQDPHEPVANYVLAKKALCFRLNPNMSESDILHYVMQGLKPEIAKTVYASNPKTLDELLSLAKNIERGIRFADSRAPNRERMAENELTGVIREMGRIISKLSEKNDNRSPKPKHVQFALPTNRNQTRNVEGAPKCWNCGKVGHAARFCRFRPQGMRNNSNFNNRFSNPNPNSGRFPAIESTPRPTFNNNRNSNHNRPNQGSYRGDRAQNREPSPVRPVVAEVERQEAESGELIFVSLNVNGVPMKCLLDTGSMVTIIRKEVAESFKRDMEPYVGSPVSSVTGDKLKIIGEVELSIGLSDTDSGDKIVVYALVAENFFFDVLLGNDFNSLAGVRVNCATKSVEFHKGSNCLGVMEGSQGVAKPFGADKLSHGKVIFTSIVTFMTIVTEGKVVVAETVNLSPFTTKNVRIKFDKFVPKEGQIYKICKGKDIEKRLGLEVEESFIVFDENLCEISISNIETKEKLLLAGTVVATYKEAEENELKNERNNVTTEVTVKTPFKEGFVYVGSSLNANEQRALLNLLTQFGDRFSFSNKTLGKCTITKCKIYTGEAQPVHQNPYRYSLSQREEIEKQIQELIEIGVVRPSKSPW